MLDSTELRKQPPHSRCGLRQTGVTLLCFLAHTSPSLSIEELDRAGGRLVLGTSLGSLTEGPEMATVSGPEKVPPHFNGLRALGLAKKRNPLGPLKPKDSFLDRTVPNMLWVWPGRPLAGPRGGNCTIRPKLKAPPSKAPPHGHRLSRERSSGLRTSSHQDTRRKRETSQCVTPWCSARAGPEEGMASLGQHTGKGAILSSKTTKKPNKQDVGHDSASNSDEACGKDKASARSSCPGHSALRRRHCRNICLRHH